MSTLDLIELFRFIKVLFSDGNLTVEVVELKELTSNTGSSSFLLGSSGSSDSSSCLVKFSFT